MPIAPASDNVPLFAALVADNVTVEAAFVFPASIVPAAVVANVEALGATKLKSLSADEGPVIETVPVAVSDIKTLPFPALALTFFAEAVNGEATLVPIFPLIEVRLSVCVFKVPVIEVLSRLL